MRTHVSILVFLHTNTLLENTSVKSSLKLTISKEPYPILLSICVWPAEIGNSFAYLQEVNLHVSNIVPHIQLNKLYL